MKRFINLLKVEKQDIFSIYIYAIFNGVVSLSLPLGIQAIINLISGGQVSTSWVILVILVIGGIALSGSMQIMQLTITENLQQKIFTRSAFEFAYRIPKIKLEAVDQIYLPELVNRFFDTLAVQKGLSKILMDFSSATLQVIFGLILLSLYHPFFILFSMLLVVIVYLIFRFTAPSGLRTSLLESKHKYEVAHWLEELARAMETFKLAGKSPLPLERTDDLVEDYLTSRKAHFKSLIVQYIYLVGFKVIIAAGLLVIGGLLVLNQQMNIGQFVASEIIIILVLASVEKLILSMETIYDVLTAVEKIGAVTDLPLEKTTGTQVSTKDKKGLSLRVNNLFYRFSENKTDTLKNIGLNIEAGEKICLSGYNGSSKSFLLQVLAGLYENFSGSVSYDSIPFGNWSKEELHSQIGDSLTKEDIFKGTLLENIALGKRFISLDEVHNITAIVGLTEYLESLPQGYSTELLPEGKNIPKNVRLKIMIARSLICNPRLVLLEDNINQLIEADKNRILDYLLSKDWTVILISNYVDVATRFDRVAVMDNGSIIAFDELENLKNESWYTNIFQSK